MHQPKKLWARTAAQQRHDQHGRSWYHRPSNTYWYHAWAQSTHRAQTREALSRILQGEEDGNVVFPYHHQHWLKWWWC